MYHYQTFKLKIRSEIHLPELLESKSIDQPQMEIRYGHVATQGLNAVTQQGVCFQVAEQTFWLCIPHIARFLISQGQWITVDPEPLADPASIKLFILNTCLGIVLLQRQQLVLQGGAVQIGSSAIAFTGSSGAGKSALIAAFMQRGYPVLTDEICLITSDGQVIPSFPRLYLWADTLKLLGLNKHPTLCKARPCIEKYSLNISSHFTDSPRPLRAVYIVTGHNKNEFSCVPLKGFQKYQPLRRHLYRHYLIENLIPKNDLLPRCGLLANHIHLAKIYRPDIGFSLDRIVDYILENLSSLAVTEAE